MIFEDINKIYFLHLSDRYDREEWMNNQIKQMDYFDYNYNIWWTCRRLFFNNENNAFSKIGHIKNNPNVISNVINCALEHYTIIRTSYERGFNHILIFEDDVKFNIDLETFKKCIEQIPDNYCCVKFINEAWKNTPYYFDLNTLTFNKIEEDNINSDLYKKINCQSFEKKHLCSTAAYLLDRSGMEKIINIYHNFNGALGADWVFKYLDYVYIPKYDLISLQNYNCPKNELLVSDLLSINTSNIFNQFTKNDNKNYIKISN